MSVVVYVPDLAEFRPLVDAAYNVPDVTVRAPKRGYWRIEAPRELTLSRKQLRLRPALWNCALAGGFRGRLREYTNDVIVLETGP